MRCISDRFLRELKDGKLKILLDEIKLDNTLDVELRGDKVIVYYRGCKLLTIYENTDFIEVNNSYKTNSEDKIENIEINTCLEKIPLVKYEMDKYLTKKENSEKEFQQLIVRENNYSIVSDSTDYYIADMEYNESDGRFDLIGVRWDSKGAIRKKSNNLALSLFELKYGNNSIKTSKNNPGLRKHLEDFKSLIDDKSRLKEICSDIEKVISQKASLGVIKNNKKKSYKFDKLRIDINKIEVIFLLINYDYESTMLKEELDTINSKEYDFPIYFAKSSYVGYGLFADKFILLSDMKERI